MRLTQRASKQTRMTKRKECGEKQGASTCNQMCSKTQHRATDCCTSMLMHQKVRILGITIDSCLIVERMWKIKSAWQRCNV